MKRYFVLLKICILYLNENKHYRMGYALDFVTNDVEGHY